MDVAADHARRERGLDVDAALPNLRATSASAPGLLASEASIASYVRNFHWPSVNARRVPASSLVTSASVPLSPQVDPLNAVMSIPF
jgi:hypothetical protein